MTPMTARIGSWIVLSILVLFLVLAIVSSDGAGTISPPAIRCPPGAMQS